MATSDEFQCSSNKTAQLVPRCPSDWGYQVMILIIILLLIEGAVCGTCYASCTLKNSKKSTRVVAATEGYFVMPLANSPYISIDS